MDPTLSNTIERAPAWLRHAIPLLLGFLGPVAFVGAITLAGLVPLGISLALFATSVLVVVVSLARRTGAEAIGAAVACMLIATTVAAPESPASSITLAIAGAFELPADMEGATGRARTALAAIQRARESDPDVDCRWQQARLRYGDTFALVAVAERLTEPPTFSHRAWLAPKTSVSFHAACMHVVADAYE